MSNITVKEKEKSLSGSLVSLFIFETPTHEYEIYAMDFKDACLTLEEEVPEIKIKDIICITEHQGPIPGLDTIH